MAAVTARRKRPQMDMALETSTWQQRVLDSTAPTVIFQSGAGRGKTYIGVAWCILKRMAQPGSRGMWISPSHPQLQQSAKPYFEELGEVWSLSRGWDWNKSERTITFKNGSVQYMRSADKPESILAADCSDVWCDELALWHPDAFRYAQGRVRTKKEGFTNQLGAGFTPKGMNWTWKHYWGPGSEARREGVEVIHPNTAVREFLTSEYRTRMEREYGEGSSWWQQEALGEFVTWEGLVYSFNAKDHLLPSADQSALRKAHKWRGFAGGIDFGFSNPAAILAAGVTESGEVIVMEEWFDTRQTLPVIAAKALEIQQRLGVHVWFCDPSGAGEIALLQQEGVNAVAAYNSIKPGVSAVEARLVNKRLAFTPDCLNTTTEFSSYAYPTDADGNVSGKDLPIDKANHCMDALRYMITGVDGTGQAPDPSGDLVTIEQVLPGFQSERFGAAM